MNNDTEIALLELEHRYGKEVRDRAEQMGLEVVKHGRWIKDQRKSKFHIEPVYICSCCREQEAWGEMELSNYCPNCGADMRGKKDGH